LVVDGAALAGAPGEFLRSVRRSNERAKVIVLDAEAADDYLMELLFLGVMGFVAYGRKPAFWKVWTRVASADSHGSLTHDRSGR
jgi:DNA-binding NarL/FixJ family response regulator